MNNRGRLSLLLFLIISILVFHTACSQKDNDRDVLQYTSEAIQVPEKVEFVSNRNFTTSSNQIFLLGREAEKEYILYALTVDGTIRSETTIPCIDTLSFSGICADGHGGVWLAQMELGLLTLLHMDADCTYLDSITTDIHEGQMALEDMAVDGDGTIIMLFSSYGDTILAGVSADGETIFQQPCSQPSTSLVEVDGKIYLLSMTEGLVPVHTASGTTESGDMQLYSFVSGGADGQIFYTEGTSLYVRQLQSKKGDALFSWSALGLSSSNIIRFKVLETGGIVCAHYSDQLSGSLAYIDVASAEDKVDEIQEITLASIAPSQQLESAVAKYNSENTMYYISLINYDRNLTQLNTEILSGQMPDIIDLYGLQTEMFVARGLLLDLYTMIDADEDTGREDYLLNLLSALEIDGGVYELPTHVEIVTLAGRTEDVGGLMGWTVEDMLDFAAGLDDGISLFNPVFSGESVLQMLVNFNQDILIHTNSFSTDWLTNLLAYCGSFTVNDGNDSSDLFVDNKYILDTVTIASPQDVQLCNIKFADEISFVGYPAPNGAGSAFTITNSLGVSSVSPHQEEAWAFLDMFVKMDSFYDTVSIPVAQAKMDTFITNQTSGEYSRSVSAADGTMIQIDAATQEDVDLFNQLLAQTSCVMRVDDTVWSIIAEESAAFFAGDKQAAETAELISNRVQIYISEQQ